MVEGKIKFDVENREILELMIQKLQQLIEERKKMEASRDSENYYQIHEDFYKYFAEIFCKY